MQTYYSQQAALHCFPDMPNYYESNSEAGKISGCASQVNTQITAPTYNANSCKIYGDKLDQYDGNSCENQKMVYEAKNSNFCKATDCNVGMGGNGQNVVWVGISYNDGGEQKHCDYAASLKRHLTIGYGDYYKNDPTMQPKTGEELKKELAEVDAGTHRWVCQTSTPKTIPLERLQEMFEKAGCTRKLTEDVQVKWWRTNSGTIQNIQNDMNAYGSLTKGCTGSTWQHDFCSPGKCATECNKKATRISVKGGGYIQISQIVAKDRNGNNVAKGSQIEAPEPYSAESRKENMVDGTEAVRPYPQLYHSKSDAAADKWVVIILPTAACISEIILYGRSDCCPDRNAGKTIQLWGQDGQALNWSAKTNSDNVQKFTIPPSTYA